MSTTVQTFVEQTKAAAKKSTLFLSVILVDYIKEVSEKAIEKASDLVDAAKVATHKVGDAASGFVKGAAAATHKLNFYSDKMYFIGTFNRHLKTVAEDIEKLELLFQNAPEGATIDDLADIIIDKIQNGGDFHTLRAKIIALKDFRDLAMEASQPKSRRLIEYLKNTANAGQLAVINALRNAFGYAPIVLADLKVDDDDVELEMDDLDVIHNVVALAFDPFDATNLHNVGITRLELKKEIVKILKMAYAGRMIASQADDNRELQTQIDIVKGRDFLMKQLSIEYTVMLKKEDPGPLLNQIAELMRNANIMTRNTMDLVKTDLHKIFNILHTVTGSLDAQDARDQITAQLAQMERDKTDWGGKYMSQRFKYNRIPPIIKALTKYVLSLKGSDHFKRAQEIITEYNQYIEEIHAARLEIYKTLGSWNLVPNLGEETEAYEVFITKTINTYVPTQAFPSAFPERIGMQVEMNMSNNELHNGNYDSGSNEEDPGEQNKNNQVFGEITRAMESSGRIKGEAKTGLGGGKRKQTRKRSSKKSKKSKKTKRIKKVKRTMKKNKGKKGKKASRKRR